MKDKRIIQQLGFLSCFALLFSGALSQNANQKQKPVYYFNPCWSPDGTLILFESTLNGESNIYSITKDAADLKQITHHKSGQGAWSPNGKMIVYYRDTNGNLQLFIDSAADGAEQQLVSTATQDYGPDWSVNGVIAFMSNATADHISHSIFTINADGTNLQQLTDSSYDCMAPRWSPNGKKLLYIRGTWTSKTYKTITRDEMQKINRSTEIMVMDVESKRDYRIAGNQSKYQNPVWSADGKNIYLKLHSDTTTVIYRMNTKGKKRKKVCQINKKIGSFDVSPQGDLIIYEYEKNKKFAIYTFNIRNGTEQKIIGDL